MTDQPPTTTGDAFLSAAAQAVPDGEFSRCGECGALAFRPPGRDFARCMADPDHAIDLQP